MTERAETTAFQVFFVPRGPVEPDDPRVGNPFARILGFRRTDTPYVIQRVGEGLPYSAYARLLKALDISQQTLGEIVRIPASTLARRQQAGRLTPAESDRLARVAKVFSDAVELFEGDKSAARKWLSSPSKALEGEAPLRYCQSELGAREVEKLIGRLEYGVFT